MAPNNAVMLVNVTLRSVHCTPGAFDVTARRCLVSAIILLAIKLKVESTKLRSCADERSAALVTCRRNELRDILLHTDFVHKWRLQANNLAAWPSEEQIAASEQVLRTRLVEHNA